MDHLLEITGLRLMLIIGCLISGVFGVSWILDFIQLRCLQHSPWSDEGVGKYSCLMKVGGGVMLLMMFRHSAVALAYYDEDGDRLQRRKERYLDEMTKQVGDVLQRATTQAQTLCGMLSAELDEKVGDHVRRMQKILQQCEKSKSPEAPAVYSRLTELMAIHLHHLRKPAIDHFQKLISLSGKAFFLEETLRQQRHTSMVKLLTVNSTRLARRMDLPRTETVQDDPELAHLIGAHLVQGADTCCSCCRRRPQTQQVASSLDKSFSLPTQADLVNELREPTQDELLNSPEAVVLQPVKLVLKWFEKIEPMQSRRDPRADVLRGVSVCGTPKTPVGQMKTVVMHLRDSPLYRSLLVGILFSVVIFIFHFHMLGVVWALLREGNQCKAVSFFMCCTELLRVLSVLAGMICYSLSLIVVIWNVEKLDAVLQVSEELHELHDFKAQIDALNANDLADEDSDISMLQVVERKLARQKRLQPPGIVAEFYNNAWGDTLDDIRHFKKLAVDLEEGLHDPPTGPAATPAGSPQYTPLPTSVTPTNTRLS